MTSYDLVPYESHPFAQTHPDRLATVATLLGMNPPPVDQCRVLELGCASGGNLIPMAQGLPGSRFVGIDLSQRQIAAAQKVVDALGLKNVELKHLSILDVDKDVGAFDYIVCHGVYSWVPNEVQDKILAICGQHLVPNGVAYVSYNTYPGWHLRGLIRDMICYHAGRFVKPQDCVSQARALLDFLAQSVSEDKSAYSMLLKEELELLRRSGDYYLFHDHLEEVNEPIYFHQFVERAAAKGLQYLGEAQLSAMLVSNLSPAVGNTLRLLAADPIQLDQYMDFVRNRTFRQTLLCHQDVALNRALDPERLSAFQVASPAQAVASEPDLASAQVAQFRGPWGTLSTPYPITKAAMHCLGEAWPRAMPFDTLLATARSRLDQKLAPDAASRAGDSQLLGLSLLECYTSPYQVVELHVCPAHFVLEIGERPIASPLARLQAAGGSRVTNLRHEGVQLSELSRQVLRHLDGTHDRAAVLKDLAGLVGQGNLVVQENGHALQDTERVHGILGESLEENLRELARGALLVA